MFLVCGVHNAGTSIMCKLLDAVPELRVIHTQGNKNCETDGKSNIWRLAVKAAGGEDFARAAKFDDLIKNGYEHYEEKMFKLNQSVLHDEFIKHFDKHTGVKENHLVAYPNLINDLFPEAIKILVVRNTGSLTISKIRQDPVAQKAQIVRMRLNSALTSWIDLPNTIVVRYENLIKNPTKYVADIVRAIDPAIDCSNANFPLVKTDKNNKWNNLNEKKKQIITEICKETQELMDARCPIVE